MIQVAFRSYTSCMDKYVLYVDKRGNAANELCIPGSPMYINILVLRRKCITGPT